MKNDLAILLMPLAIVITLVLLWYVMRAPVPQPAPPMVAKPAIVAEPALKAIPMELGSV